MSMVKISKPSFLGISDDCDGGGDGGGGCKVSDQI